MEKARTMKVRLTLSEDIDITPEVNEWLRCVQDKISKEYSKIEAEIKSRMLSGFPIVFEDGKLADVEDMMVLPEIKALSPDISKKGHSDISNSPRTGRQHD